jgi:hypothetical protein
MKATMVISGLVPAVISFFLGLVVTIVPLFSWSFPAYFNTSSGNFLASFLYFK